MKGDFAMYENENKNMNDTEDQDNKKSGNKKNGDKK